MGDILESGIWVTPRRLWKFAKNCCDQKLVAGIWYKYTVSDGNCYIKPILWMLRIVWKCLKSPLLVSPNNSFLWVQLQYYMCRKLAQNCGTSWECRYCFLLPVCYLFSSRNWMDKLNSSTWWRLTSSYFTRYLITLYEYHEKCYLQLKQTSYWYLTPPMV